MPSAQIPPARVAYTDGNGDPLVGGTVAFCEPATAGSTYRPIFADEAEAVPAQNPCPLDASGIPFSGGSQITIWGNGKYEMFVRDANQVLMYSSLIDTQIAEAASGGGDLNITGNINATGDITAGGAVTGSHLTSTGNADIAGTLNVGAVAANAITANSLTTGGFTATGNATIDGNLQVNGIASLETIDTNKLNVQQGGADFNGSNIANVGEIDANIGHFNQLLVGGVPIPKMQGATFFLAIGNAITTIPFPQPFNSTPTVVVSVDTPGESVVVQNPTPSGFDAFSTTLAGGFNIYWIALGT